MERALIGDIGGTHARFATVELQLGALTLETLRTYRCGEFSSLQDIIALHLQGGGARDLDAVGIAVAGPVLDGATVMTNLAWSISETALAAMGFRRARLVNDFEALAFGLGDLGVQDVEPVGATPPPRPGQTLAVLGAGTGFGAAALVRRDGRTMVLASEGGHVSFAPVDALEVAVLHHLAAAFGRVSVERLLSGPGMVNLYRALAAIGGEPAPLATPAEIAGGAVAGERLATDTVERFCSIYGAVAGDMALSFGARGGVFLAGGIAPQLQTFLQRGDFRKAFTAKGRYAPYLTAIPTAVVVNPYLALIGAARALQG